MDVFDLSAKLRLDSSEYEKGLSGAADKARGIGQSIGGAVGTVAKATAAGVAAAGAAVGALAKQSVDAYSEYQQLSGGVETLFKSSSDTVMEYAQNAYKTAGLSANEYMETVTSFSASLIQSTGRGAQTDLEQLESTLDDEYKATKRSLEDQYKEAQKYWSDRLAMAKDTTEKDAIKAQRDAMLTDLKRSNEDQLAALKEHNKEALAEAEKLNSTSVTTEESLQRAAELADMAIIDMSDNANRMGTDMASIQNAYQGFAKQNYTMLDNLKLGYGGTKEEMERLLRTAEDIKAKQGEVAEYSVNSYADIVEAIHVVQDEMGITGTTSKEASETISGSLNMVKGAWDNLVIGFGNDQADIGALIQDLVSSAEGAFMNLLPVVEQVLKGIGSFVDKIAPIISEKLPHLVATLLPMLLNTATNLLNSVANALPGLINALIEVIPTIMNTLLQTATSLLPQLVGVAEQAILTIVNGLLQNIRPITDTAIEIVLTLVDGLVDTLPELIPAAMEAIITIVEGLLDNMDKLIDAAAKLITALAEGLLKAIDILLQKAPTIVSKLTEAIVTNAPKLMIAAAEIITKLALYIVENLPKIVEVAAQLVVSFIGGVAELYGQLNIVGWNMVVSVWNGIAKLNPFKWGADLIMGFVNGILSGISSVINAASRVAGAVRSYIGFSEPEKGPLSDFHTYAPDMMKLFAQGIADNEHLVTDQLNKSFNFDTDITAPSSSSLLSTAPAISGDITINVYGAEGQSINDLANAVMERLTHITERDRRAFA